MKVAVLIDTRSLEVYDIVAAKFIDTGITLFRDISEIIEKDFNTLIVFDEWAKYPANFDLLLYLKIVRKYRIFVATMGKITLPSTNDSGVQILQLESNEIEPKVFTYLPQGGKETEEEDTEETLETEFTIFSETDEIARKYPEDTQLHTLLGNVNFIMSKNNMLLSLQAKDKRTIANLENVIDTQVGLIDELRGRVLSLEQQAGVINGQIFKYKSLFSKSQDYIFNKEEFPNAPRILILKEYRNFKYLSEIMDTLSLTLMNHHNRTSKILWILDKHNPSKIVEVPKAYYLMKDKLKKDELYKNNVIVAIDYRDVLENYLINKANVDLLIIVDSRLNNTQFILDENIITFSLLDESKYIEPLGLLFSNSIVNHIEKEEVEESTLWCPEDLDEISLSVQPAIKRIVDVLQERWWNM